MKKERNKAKICIGMLLMILGVAFGGFPLIIGDMNGNIIEYLVIGLLVFSAGLADIILELKKTKIINELILRNEYIYADFESIKETCHNDDNVKRTAFFAVFRYKDDRGNIHFFRSEEYDDRYSVPFKHGDMAKIYVDIADPKTYLVCSKEMLEKDDMLNIYRGRKHKTKKIGTGLIIGGAAFILVPFIMGITVVMTKEAVLPLFIAMFLFFGIFSAIGTTSILKGIMELRK